MLNFRGSHAVALRDAYCLLRLKMGGRLPIDLGLLVVGMCVPRQLLPENVTCEFIHP